MMIDWDDKGKGRQEDGRQRPTRTLEGCWNIVTDTEYTRYLDIQVFFQYIAGPPVMPGSLRGLWCYTALTYGTVDIHYPNLCQTDAQKTERKRERAMNEAGCNWRVPRPGGSIRD